MFVLEARLQKHQNCEMGLEENPINRECSGDSIVININHVPCDCHQNGCVSENLELGMPYEEEFAGKSVSTVVEHCVSRRGKKINRLIRGMNSKKKQGKKLAEKIGQKFADLIAKWVGSWTFIITQSLIFVFWVIYNSLKLHGYWDPYPFILLNLMLSFQAAYTGPIIMVSQNRQDQIDRLKAADLDEKVDHLRILLTLEIQDMIHKQNELLQSFLTKAYLAHNSEDDNDKNQSSKV